MFPAGCGLLRARRAVAALTVSMAAVALTAPSVSQAEPAPPPLRKVQYTVWTEQPYPSAEIYYRDTDPPNWAEYSHNPYLYSPNIETVVGPEQQWNLEVYLADPDQWAMVTSGIAPDSEARPNFHCALAVDGQVVKTSQGPKGALCSIRPW
ncbi:hypothetical protein DVS77_10835 [Mycolicibacterium moriokaense]|nr:hypothetical protein DVS77_10835 [Mycolicibacterium moriokaense]